MVEGCHLDVGESGLRPGWPRPQSASGRDGHPQGDGEREAKHDYEATLGQPISVRAERRLLSGSTGRHAAPGRLESYRRHTPDGRAQRLAIDSGGELRREETKEARERTAGLD